MDVKACTELTALNPPQTLEELEERHSSLTQRIQTTWNRLSNTRWIRWCPPLSQSASLIRISIGTGLYLLLTGIISPLIKMVCAGQEAMCESGKITFIVLFSSGYCLFCVCCIRGVSYELGPAPDYLRLEKDSVRMDAIKKVMEKIKSYESFWREFLETREEEKIRGLLECLEQVHQALVACNAHFNGTVPSLFFLRETLRKEINKAKELPKEEDFEAGLEVHSEVVKKIQNLVFLYLEYEEETSPKYKEKASFADLSISEIEV